MKTTEFNLIETCPKASGLRWWRMVVLVALSQMIIEMSWESNERPRNMRRFAYMEPNLSPVACNMTCIPSCSKAGSSWLLLDFISGSTLALSTCKTSHLVADSSKDKFLKRNRFQWSLGIKREFEVFKNARERHLVKRPIFTAPKAMGTMFRMLRREMLYLFFF